MPITSSCCGSCARCPGEEGLRALGHPLRLRHGRSRPHVPARAGGASRVGSAEGGSRACVRQRAALHGQTRRGRLRALRRGLRSGKREGGQKQFLVPYLMSSHPAPRSKRRWSLPSTAGSGLYARAGAGFHPTPSTVSTCMYYTGLDPRTMKPVYVPRSSHERRFSALIQYRNPANYDLVHEALVRAGRRDLIGYGDACLIRPRRQAGCRTRAARRRRAGAGKRRRASAHRRIGRRSGARAASGESSPPTVRRIARREPRATAARGRRAMLVGRAADRIAQDGRGFAMRILTISAQKPDSTGSGVYLASLADALARRGMTSASSPAWPPTTRARAQCATYAGFVRFDSDELPFHVFGMSDEMPYPSSRYREMTSDQLRRFETAFQRAFDGPSRNSSPMRFCATIST